MNKPKITMDYHDIMKKIESEKFVVYGAGRFGKKLMAALEKRGLSGNFLGYAVTDNTGMPAKVRNIKEIDRNTFIVIAAHPVNNGQMMELLIREGFSNAVDIYPCFYEIICGEPIERDHEIDVKEFARTCRQADGVTLRWLAIDYILGKNDYGKNMYMEFLKKGSNEMSTVEARWELFADRVHSYQTQGYFEEPNIKIVPGDRHVIDGMHRLALAYYFGIEKIKADIYRSDMGYYIDLFQLTEDGDEAVRDRFSPEEYRMIQKKKKEILGR